VNLFFKEDANVITVDWAKGAKTLNYFQAVSNTKVVGAEIALYKNK
jgi:Lipase